MSVGKGSKFERLPEELRKEARQRIASKKYTNAEIAEFINAELTKYSVQETDVDSIDDNTVWREGSKMKALADDMRRTQTAMEAVSNKVDLTSIGEQGQLLMSMLTSAIFKTTHGLIEGEDPIDAETLGDLVLSVSRLQKSAQINQKLKQEIRDAARKEALADAEEQATQAGKKAGLSSGNIALIREAIAGARL